MDYETLLDSLAESGNLTKACREAGVSSIYGLYDSQGALRYIGKAADPAKRLKSHMRDSLTRHTPLYAWIRKNGIPEMRLLEEHCVDWRTSERRHIAEARDRGEKLLNLADGGDEPYCSLETRRANGAKLSHKLATDPEFRRRRESARFMAAAIKDGFVSNRVRQKLRDAALFVSAYRNFANLPDRTEDADGRGLVRVGKRYVTA